MTDKPAKPAPSPREPREIIADVLPAFSHCYKNPEAIIFPSRSDLRVAADAVIAALNAAGWRITR